MEVKPPDFTKPDPTMTSSTSSRWLDHAFYQMPARFWELLAGAIVFDRVLDVWDPKNPRMRRWPLPILVLCDLFIFILLAICCVEGQHDRMST